TVIHPGVHPANIARGQCIGWPVRSLDPVQNPVKAVIVKIPQRSRSISISKSIRWFARLRRIGAEFSFGIPAQAPHRSDCELPIGLDPYPLYSIVRQAVACRIASEPAALIAGQAPVFSAGPQYAGRVIRQATEPVAVDSGAAALVENGEVNPIESHQSIGCCKPQVAVSRLQDRPNRVLRKPVICCPGVESVLSASNWRGK